MQVIDKLKNVLFGEDSSNYELSLNEMKDSLNKLIMEYNEFINLQEEFKKNPKLILNDEFEKKEKYPEIMDKIKYKDVELIKEYEFYAMKYNILVELYNKLKKYILNIKQSFILDFRMDKYKQPVALLSPYGDEINKIILIKNTLSSEDYLLYKIGDNINIIDIFSNEQRVNHAKFMIEMLVDTIKTLNNDKLSNSEITVSKDVIDKIGSENSSIFFKKQGFEVSNETIKRKVV